MGNWPWEFLVEEFLTSRNAAALGDKAHTIQFWQKYMADFYDSTVFSDFDRLPSTEIQSDPTKDDEIEWTDPKTGDKLTFKHRQMMVDVQMRELWVMVDAWSDDGDDITLPRSSSVTSTDPAGTARANRSASAAIPRFFLSSTSCSTSGPSPRGRPVLSNLWK